MPAPARSTSPGAPRCRNATSTPSSAASRRCWRPASPSARNACALPLDLPVPHSREALTATLMAFGRTLLREVSRPEVLATHRLAIAEAEHAPELARTLDELGRRPTLAALAELLSAAQTRGLLVRGGSGGDRGYLPVAAVARRADDAAAATGRRRPKRRGAGAAGAVCHGNGDAAVLCGVMVERCRYQRRCRWSLVGPKSAAHSAVGTLADCASPGCGSGRG